MFDARMLNRALLSFLPLFSLALHILLQSPFGAGSPHPEVLRDPIQTAITPPLRIERRADGRIYKMETLFLYDIAGLVVSRWGGLFEVDEMTFLNVGLAWGDNITSKAYSKFEFKNDFYRLYFRPKSNRAADMALLRQDQVSNNHLLVLDEELQKRIMKISKWDQIRITGRLVSVEIFDVSGQKVGGKGTSTVRDDTGCETIYVEDVQTLKKGRPIFRWIHAAAFYGWLILLASNLDYWLRYPERF